MSLADDELVYKDDMRGAGLPALLVSLFSVYQAMPGTDHRDAALLCLTCCFICCVQELLWVLVSLAGDELVYKDSMQDAGAAGVLADCVSSPLGNNIDAIMLPLGCCMCRVQELLWVLVSLADDDLVYKDDMRDAGLPALLVSLLSVYQANQGAAELRPIAAQILRCLQLMAAGDEAMQVRTESCAGEQGRSVGSADPGNGAATGSTVYYWWSLCTQVLGTGWQYSKAQGRQSCSGLQCRSCVVCS